MSVVHKFILAQWYLITEFVQLIFARASDRRHKSDEMHPWSIAPSSVHTVGSQHSIHAQLDENIRRRDYLAQANAIKKR